MLTETQIADILSKRPENVPAHDIRAYTESIKDCFRNLICKLDNDELRQLRDELARRIDFDRHVPKGMKKRYPLSALKFDELYFEHRRRFPEMYRGCSGEDCDICEGM